MKKMLKDRYVRKQVIQYMAICILFCFCLIGKKETVQAFTTLNGEWEYVLDNSAGQMRIFKYLGTDKEVTIPATYKINNKVYDIVLDGSVFENNTTLEKVTFEDGVSAISCFAMFSGCSNLVSAPDVPAGAKNCSYMFLKCVSLTSAPKISTEATNCTYMFYGCTSLVNAPEIPAGVENCSGMFTDCTNLVSAPENIPASVVSCSNMFERCENLKNAPTILPGVTNCSAMFKECISLTNAPEIPVSVTNCTEMFFGCNNLTQAPKIPSSVTNCTSMFNECSSLTSAPDISASVVNCDSMFYNCKKLSGSMQVLGKPAVYNNMFYNAGIDGSGLVVYCLDDNVRSKITANTGSSTKIEVRIAAKKTITVTFDGNGGTSSTSTKEVEVDGTYGELPTAVRSGYDFNGWFTAKTGGTKVEAGTKVTNTSAHTLYAQWTKKASQSSAGTTSQATTASSGGENQNAGTSTGRTVPHYDIRTNGGTWTGSLYYKADGTLATECFFCDGTYTYYLMNDGTPMKNRLTYHPNGVNLIYFDEYGHELFDQFQFCEDVQYTCYFDTYGYMYFSVATFWNGNAYYMDATGRMQNNGWFVYDNNNIDIGYANADGSLLTDQFSYDQWGRMVYFGADGRIAKGLISDGIYYYQMDETDGHLIGMFPVNE